jgi:hypothetical protein
MYSVLREKFRLMETCRTINSRHVFGPRSVPPLPTAQPTALPLVGNGNGPLLGTNYPGSESPPPPPMYAQNCAAPPFSGMTS